MAELETAATSARLVASRRLQASPCASPGLIFSASGKLAEALRDVVAACPDLKAVREALNSSVADLVRAPYVVKSCSAVEGGCLAVEAVRHNAQPGLLSTLPPDILERILRRIPELSFRQTGYASLPRSSLACKAMWAAYSRFAACFKLEWRIEKFGGLRAASVYGPPEAGDGLLRLGRRWRILVYPKGEGAGAASHVSVFLAGQPPEEGVARGVEVTLEVKCGVDIGGAGAARSCRGHMHGVSTLEDVDDNAGFSTLLALSDLNRALATQPVPPVVITIMVHARTLLPDPQAPVTAS